MRTVLHYFSIFVTLQLVIFINLSSQHGNNDYIHHEGQKINLHRKGHESNLTLSESLWEGASDLLPQAWNATFIRGVKNGDMDPNFYGDYILQDAIYLRKVGQYWQQLANNDTINPNLASHANASFPGYIKWAKMLFETFHIQDDGEDKYGVIPGSPVTSYTTFIEENMLENPYNMLIVTYPCLKLWTNLTYELWSLVHNSTTNPYKGWVHDNMSNTSTITQAKLIDEWSHIYDPDEALELFRMGIRHEINFFNRAGNSSKALFKVEEHNMRGVAHQII